MSQEISEGWSDTVKAVQEQSCTAFLFYDNPVGANFGFFLSASPQKE
jgi:hypothetical protein